MAKRGSAARLPKRRARRRAAPPPPPEAFVDVLTARALGAALPMDFLALQQHVDAEALAKAVNTLYRQLVRFRLEDASFVLAATLAARFLSVRRVTARALNAICGACLSIACKWCQTSSPRLADLGHGVTLDAELLVLDALEWRVGLPTSLDFLERFRTRGNANTNEGALFLALLSAHIALSHSTRADVVALACFRLGARAADERVELPAVADAEPEAMMVALTDMLPRTEVFEALLASWVRTHARLAAALR